MISTFLVKIVNNILFTFSCGSEEWCVETHAGHKIETRLSATTEPFVPTCQRRVVKDHPTTDSASTINYVTVAKVGQCCCFMLTYQLIYSSLLNFRGTVQT